MYLTERGSGGEEEGGLMNKAGREGIRAGRGKVWLREAAVSICPPTLSKKQPMAPSAAEIFSSHCASEVSHRVPSWVRCTAPACGLHFAVTVKVSLLEHHFPVTAVTSRAPEEIHLRVWEFPSTTCWLYCTTICSGSSKKQDKFDKLHCFTFHRTFTKSVTVDDARRSNRFVTTTSGISK